MRITGGTARGKVLLTPRGQATRPTDAKTRETLFNLLAQEVVDARFLDLYAGSGAIGLEALSRGAASCALVEQNKSAAALIRKNLELCNWQEQGMVWPCAVQVALKKLNQQNRQFDIIFADPPFDRQREWDDFAAGIDKVALLLHNSTVVSPQVGLLIVQHSFRLSLDFPEKFEPVQERRAGESMLSFFQIK
ncbi:MAG: 16S rRNA (guanine(966)-N(2))-methyltransferase RsmD [Abditibacteriaceae bacterium]